MTLKRDDKGVPIEGTVGELLDGMSPAARKHPLASQDGLVAFEVMLAACMVKGTVKCQGVDKDCGWTGRRTGGFVSAADKPCPRCGSSVEFIPRVAQEGTP